MSLSKTWQHLIIGLNVRLAIHSQLTILFYSCIDQNMCATFQFNMLRLRPCLRDVISPISHCIEAWRLIVSRQHDKPDPLKLKSQSVVARPVLPLLFLPFVT